MRRLKGRQVKWEYFPLPLTSGLHWRGLALAQSTLDAKRGGIWKRRKKDEAGSVVPHGHYLHRQRVISLPKYSGLSSRYY